MDRNAALELLRNAVAACSVDFRRGADDVTEAICDVIGAPQREDGEVRARVYFNPRDRTVNLGVVELQALVRAISDS